MAAYIRDIISNTNDSHQSSPGWVLTFINWNNRDTLNYKTIDPSATRGPLVVQSDCTQLSVFNSKNNLTPSADMTLKGGEIDYSAAIAPGDFVFINMLNWQSHADTIVKKALALSPINNYTDGFKGLYKVQSVRRTLQTGNNGEKVLVYKITAYAFTEFNNTIYFNPYLITPNEKTNDLLFITRIGEQWNSNITQKSTRNVQDIVKLLVQAFIGKGLDSKGLAIKGGSLRNANSMYFMPQAVGKLLGLPNVKVAADIYQLLFGIQQYTSNSTGAGGPQYGFTPDIKSQVTGSSYLKAEYWNQVKLWSIMSQYNNDVVNEMYTTFRVTPNNTILPVVILRQKPFTTEHFYNANKQLQLTRFLNLPRWRVDPSLILNFDIGRDDAARINFVQVFGRSRLPNSGDGIQVQIALGNYVFDINDVRRNGLRPYIPTSNFDYPTLDNVKGYLAPTWAKMVGDWVIDGHLKENGTISMFGVQEPICVGDNYQLGSWVFHIESVQETCQVNPDGTKTFRTVLTVSNGVDERSSATQPYYNEMDNLAAANRQKEDWDNEQMYPGISDTQVNEYNYVSPKIPLPSFKPFTPVKKPRTKK